MKKKQPLHRHPINPPQPQQTNKKADELQFINGFNNNGETIKNSDQTNGLL